MSSLRWLEPGPPACWMSILMKLKSIDFLILFAVSLPALVLNLDEYPPVWFDEGYKLNAAYTVVTQGVYGTYTSDGLQPFDPGISSGPVEILAIALVFKGFGVGILQARLLIVFFALLALFSLYQVARTLYGRPQALFACLFMLSAPAIQGVNFTLMGRQVLGEIPSLGLIIFGIWLWLEGWKSNKLYLSVISGLALGLGILSKNQIAISLIPALVIIAFIRTIRKPGLFWLMWLPIFLVLAVQAGWFTLGWALTPESVKYENARMLREAIQTNLLTGLLGRSLNHGALAITLLMVFGVVTGTLRLWRLRSSIREWAFWAEALLVLFVTFAAGWFSLESVGWPRYAFAGDVVGLILVAKAMWDVLFHRIGAFSRWLLKDKNYAYSFTVLGLVLFAGVNNLYPLSQAKEGDYAEEVGEFIQATVPQKAVIETWEWELDAISGHMQMHHPHQSYLYEAIRQFSHQETAFNLEYDLLQADPQYLITGPFSDWTRIYDPAQIKLYFREIKPSGPYRVYKRID